MTELSHDLARWFRGTRARRLAKPRTQCRIVSWSGSNQHSIQMPPMMAGNCHLHRSPERDIAVASLAPSEAALAQQERLLLGSMWPVTCQCCGALAAARMTELCQTPRQHLPLLGSLVQVVL